MNFLFPDRRALCIAENATHNLHNILTLRGALVRDPHGWAAYLDEAIVLFADGSRRPLRPAPLAALGDRADRRLPRQAARSLRLHPRSGAAPAEQGLCRRRDRRAAGAAAEPRERVALPRLLRLAEPQPQGGLPALPRMVRRQPRRTYGRIRPRPRASATWRWPAVPTRCSTTPARRSRRGDFRWVAEVVNHLVFADPGNAEAKSSRRVRSSSSPTAPRTGPGATSSSWAPKNCATAPAGPRPSIPPDFIASLTNQQFFSALAVQIDGPRAGDRHITLHWRFTDTGTRTPAHPPARRPDPPPRRPHRCRSMRR